MALLQGVLFFCVVGVVQGLEARFERYGELIATALSHADRRLPAQWYLKGLMLPGGRKSAEPMAARVQPQNVRSAHQSMHHLVADADWNDASCWRRSHPRCCRG